MIPVVINNRDIDIRDLVRWFLCAETVEIHICDNASTYPRLVEYLDWCEWVHRRGINAPGVYRAPVVHRGHNRGPRGACEIVAKMRPDWERAGYRYYATTDGDLDLTGVPYDALQVFAHEMDITGSLVKVGCALRLDDLPDTPQARFAASAEAKHWLRGFPEGFTHVKVGSKRSAPAYSADIDTTLAVYRLNPPWDGSYGPAVRLAGEYQARHLPWYHTAENRPEDYRWYLDHADPQGTVYTARSCRSDHV